MLPLIFVFAIKLPHASHVDAQIFAKVAVQATATQIFTANAKIHLIGKEMTV